MVRSRLAPVLLLLAALACQIQEDRLAEHQAKGDAFLAEQKWEEAVLEFKSGLAVDPNSAKAHYGLALAYLGFKDPRRAYWELEETVRRIIRQVAVEEIGKKPEVTVVVSRLAEE